MDFDGISTAFGDFFNNYGVPLGIGAQAAGTMMRKRALEKVRAEQSRKMAAEAERQRALQQERDARVAQVMPQLTPEAVETQRLSIAKQFEDYMQPTMAAKGSGEYVTGGATVPAEVRERAEAELAGARNKGKAHVTNLANLQAYGAQQGRQAGMLRDAAADVSRISRASERSSGVLPFELEAAHRKGDKLNTWADVANTGGSLAFLYGATAPKKKPPQPYSQGGPFTGGFSGKAKGVPGLKLGG